MEVNKKKKAEKLAKKMLKMHIDLQTTRAALWLLIDKWYRNDTPTNEYETDAYSSLFRDVEDDVLQSVMTDRPNYYAEIMDILSE